MYGNRVNRLFMLLLPLVVCASDKAASQKPQDATKRLTFPAAGQAAGTAGAQLLPAPQEMIDADAFPLVRKAVQSLPKGLDWGKIRVWRQTPLKELPREEIESLLRQTDATLQWLEQAGRYRRCDWPLNSEDEPPVELNACRNLALLVAVKAHSQLARGDCVSSARTFGTGLALAKHLGEGPTLIHLLVGVAVGAVVCDEIELYMQQPGAPSLAVALRAIPVPSFDEKRSELYGMDEGGRGKAQLVLARANRNVLVLQYLETLRACATQAGRWPPTFEDLKADLPSDPVSGKPFSYRRLSDTQAILEGPLPKGGDAKDNIRYELNLVKKP
jgi:hypothetical protein